MKEGAVGAHERVIVRQVHSHVLLKVGDTHPLLVELDAKGAVGDTRHVVHALRQMRGRISFE